MALGQSAGFAEGEVIKILFEESEGRTTEAAADNHGYRSSIELPMCLKRRKDSLSKNHKGDLEKPKRSE